MQVLLSTEPSLSSLHCPNFRFHSHVFPKDLNFRPLDFLFVYTSPVPRSSLRMSTKTIEGWLCPLTDGCHCEEGKLHRCTSSLDAPFHADRTRTTGNRMFNYQSQLPCGCGSDLRPTPTFCPVFSSQLGVTEWLKTSTVPFNALPNHIWSLPFLSFYTQRLTRTISALRQATSTFHTWVSG